VRTRPSPIAPPPLLVKAVRIPSAHHRLCCHFLLAPRLSLQEGSARFRPIGDDKTSSHACKPKDVDRWDQPLGSLQAASWSECPGFGPTLAHCSPESLTEAGHLYSGPLRTVANTAQRAHPALSKSTGARKAEAFTPDECTASNHSQLAFFCISDPGRRCRCLMNTQIVRSWH
jgi:hypothetical protein